MNEVAVQKLGLIDYEKALNLQEKTIADIKEKKSPETIFVCQHPEVITIGRGLDAKSEVLDNSIPQFEISRGGRATLHLPGQVVIYPILDLNQRTRDLHAYLRLLESAIIETLLDFRVESITIEGKTGVWVEDRKIASIGIAARHWITYHGLALNVICDLDEFKKIKPCGFEASVMTSVWNELTPDYKKRWELEPESFYKQVEQRLLENILIHINSENFLQN